MRKKKKNTSFLETVVGVVEPLVVGVVESSGLLVEGAVLLDPTFGRQGNGAGLGDALATIQGQVDQEDGVQEVGDSRSTHDPRETDAPHEFAARDGT